MEQDSDLMVVINFILKYYMTVVLGSFFAGLRYLRSAQPEKNWRVATERLLACHNSASNTTHSTIASQKPSACVLHTVQNALTAYSKTYYYNE